MFDAGIVAGAVYNPLVYTVPAVALQFVAPLEVNCCVVPRLTIALVGAIVCGGGATRVTVAEADPPGPVAVTVTLFDAGIVAGAV